MNRTAQEVYTAIDFESRVILYRLIGYILNHGEYEIYDWRLLKSRLDEEQLTLCQLILEDARKAFRKESDIL